MGGNTNGFKPVLCLIGLLLLTPLGAQEIANEAPVVSEDGQDPEPQQPSGRLQEMRDTLLFGIDSEVISIVDRIAEEDERGLDSEVAVRFQESRSTALRVRIIDYFSGLEDPILADAARALFLGEDTPPAELLRAVISYLSDTVEDSSVETLPRYKELAEDGDPLIASMAIRAMGDHGDPEAVSQLLELFTDLASDDLRGSVVRALGATGSAEALPLLEGLAADEYEVSSLRHYATESLGRIAAEQSLPLVLALAAEEDAILRAYAVDAASAYPTEDAETLLLEALRDSFWRVRVAALKGIARNGWISTDDAVSYKARRDPERPVRLEAIATLGSLATPVAAETLREIVSDVRSGDDERIAAISQLFERELAGSIESFEKVMDQEWAREGSRVLDALGKAISRSEDPAIVPLVDRIVDHPNYIIRIYAMRAIGKGGLDQYTDWLTGIADASSRGLMFDSAVGALEKLGIGYTPPEESEEETADQVQENNADPNPEGDDDSVPEAPPESEGTNPGADSTETESSVPQDW